MMFEIALLCLTVVVDAHNWMSSPSRANNNFNAYMEAPCPPKGARIHFQVQAGQLFPFEYATGHGTPARGGVYVTVLKAEDSAMMKKHTRALLDDYLESAPAGHSYMSDQKAHHIGIAGGASLKPGNVRDKFDQYVEGVMAPDGVTPLAHIRDYYNWAMKPGKNAGIYEKTEAATKDDIRVSYYNPKYPWIVAAHKFKLHEDKTDDSDLVMMEIPPGSDPGVYVVQYTWNGYYDCTDVNVIAEKSTDWFGKPGNGIAYDKVDHCLWNPEVSPPQGQSNTYVAPVGTSKCQVFHRDDDAGVRRCKKACEDAGDGCTGVQVVPLKLKPQTGHDGLFKWPTGARKTYPEKCGDLTGESDDLVCFTVKKGNSVVGGPTLTTRDPLDSVFYGTCLIKGNAWSFQQSSGQSTDIPPEGSFVFGRECVTCDSVERNKNPDRVPWWNVTFDVACDHCNPALGR